MSEVRRTARRIRYRSTRLLASGRQALGLPREEVVDKILDWLTRYSPPVVLLLALGGIFIFVSKQVTENAISAQFERYKKQNEKPLTRPFADQSKRNRSPILPIIRHLSSDIDVNLIATNRIMVCRLVRFVPREQT